MVLIIVLIVVVLGAQATDEERRKEVNDMRLAAERLEMLNERKQSLTSCGYCGKAAPYACWDEGVCEECAGSITSSLRGGARVPWGGPR